MIHDRFANVVDSKTEGIMARFGAGFETSWGGYGAYGTWRREMNTERTVDWRPGARRASEGHDTRQVFRRGAATVRAIWSVSHRSGFANALGTGRFDPWTGHDLRVGLDQPGGAGRAPDHGRHLQPDRRGLHGRHREPGEHGRPHRGRMGADVLSVAQHGVLRDVVMYGRPR